MENRWWRERNEWRESVDDVDTGKKMKKKKKRRVWGWRGGWWDGKERRTRKGKVNGQIRWKADIISGCESFITERRSGRGWNFWCSSKQIWISESSQRNSTERGGGSPGREEVGEREREKRDDREEEGK